MIKIKLSIHVVYEVFVEFEAKQLYYKIIGIEEIYIQNYTIDAFICDMLYNNETMKIIPWLR